LRGFVLSLASLTHLVLLDGDALDSGNGAHAELHDGLAGLLLGAVLLAASGGGDLAGLLVFVLDEIRDRVLVGVLRLRKVVGLVT